MDAGVDEQAGLPSKRKVAETNSPPPLGASGSVDSPAPLPQPQCGLSSRRSVRRRVSSSRLEEPLLDDPRNGPSPACAPRRSQSCPPTPVLAQPTTTKARRPGKLPACGQHVCGDTTGWVDPCSVCASERGHAGRLLCSACHSEALLTPANKLVWKHISEGDVGRAAQLWEAHSAETPQVGTIIQEGFIPTTKCLCSRPACFHALFKKLDRGDKQKNTSRCVACNTTKSALWRSITSDLSSYQRWFMLGESRGSCVKEGNIVLEIGNTICNACGLEFRDKGDKWLHANSPKHTVPSFLVYLRQTEAGCKPHDLSLNQASQPVLKVLGTGCPVPLEDGMAMVSKARQDLGLVDAGEKRIAFLTRLMYDQLSEDVDGANCVTFDGGQVGDDNRSTSQYMMPAVLDYLYVANLHRGLRRCEGEVHRLKEAARGREKAGAQGANEQDKDRLAKVADVGRMVHADIMGWKEWFNNKRGGDKSARFDLKVPDPGPYALQHFPPTLRALLVSTCGFWDLSPEDVKGSVLNPTRDGRRHALFVYMVGTMIGKAVIKDSFMPLHYLKLSQTLKLRGVGAAPMRLLSELNLCMSDRQRYAQEELLVLVPDTLLMPSDQDVVVSVAWDNNDTDGTPKFATHSHNGNIGATGHYQKAPSVPPVRFRLEEEWLPVEDVTMDMLLTGRTRDEHHATWSKWQETVLGAVGSSPEYLTAEESKRSCLEAELRKIIPSATVQVVSKNLFIQIGSTKSEDDCFAALERIRIITHAGGGWQNDRVGGPGYGEVLRRVLVEGDEETFRFMVRIKKDNPEKFRWLIPHPGGWHIMLHTTKALLLKYWGAGVESVAKLLGGDDRHAAAGSNYRRSHHFLTVTFEAMWCVVVEMYVKENPSSAESGAVPLKAPDVVKDVIPWLRETSVNHKTMRLWVDFLLHDYPAYLAFRTAARTGDYKLRCAALRELAYLFTAAGKNRYQELCAWHLRDLARMTDDDMKAASCVFTASFSGDDFANVHLDEFMEMMNRIVKQALGKITPAFTVKLAPITDSRAEACAEVDEMLRPAYKARDRVTGLIKDRAGVMPKILPWVRTCRAVMESGRARLFSLSGAVTTAKDEEGMLLASEVGHRRWKSVLQSVVLSGGGGQHPSRTREPVFRSENETLRASLTPKKLTYSQKEWQDMSIQQQEYYAVLRQSMSEAGGLDAKKLEELKGRFGAVLPMAMSHAGGGGGRKANKADGLNCFVEKHCQDAFQPSQFYKVGGVAVDLATELHRSPGSLALSKGGQGLVRHYEKKILHDYVSFGKTAVVAMCYDIADLVPPIKVLEQASRSAATGSFDGEFDPLCEAPISNKTFQAFLRAKNNRDLLAGNICSSVLARSDVKGTGTTMLMLGMTLPGSVPLARDTTGAAGATGAGTSGQTGVASGTFNAAAAAVAGTLGQAESAAGTFGAAGPAVVGAFGAAGAAVAGTSGQAGVVAGAIGAARATGMGAPASVRGCHGEGAALSGGGDNAGVPLPAGSVGAPAEKVNVRSPLQMVVWGDGEPRWSGGPEIGEGELSTTHVVVHHTKYTDGEPVKEWMVMSVDTDQVIHLLLAMASGHIPPDGDGKVSVTVLQKKAQGKANYVDVNRVYEAICDKPNWNEGNEGIEGNEGARPPQWLTRQAKVVLFTVVYFLGGCDFLPAIHSMPFKVMFPTLVKTVSQPGLFVKPIVYQPEGGRWCVDIEECVKLLGVFYFQVHYDVFKTQYASGAREMFASADVNRRVTTFVETIRMVIWKTKGEHGKKQCPHKDALVLHVKRADAVLEYWQSALALKAAPVRFEGRGWATASGKEGEQITKSNVAIKLSSHALLNSNGKVKLLVCGCKPDKARKHNCRNCTCGQLKKKCVFGYCKCECVCYLERGDFEMDRAASAEAGDDCDSDGGNGVANSDLPDSDGQAAEDNGEPSDNLEDLGAGSGGGADDDACFGAGRGEDSDEDDDTEFDLWRSTPRRILGPAGTLDVTDALECDGEDGTFEDMEDDCGEEDFF